MKIIEATIAKINKIDFCRIDFVYCYYSYIQFIHDENQFIKRICDSIKYFLTNNFHLLYKDCGYVLIKVNGMIDLDLYYNPRTRNIEKIQKRLV